jgi:cytochrome d ubiquinol oxidase subunit II
MEELQIYWWFIISLLGGLLVFLLFVQGGQTMILSAHDAGRKTLLVNALGRKWELTFTTLVTFGGAFFASFPLYYSTSFGGAYWLWVLILLSFVLQAVSYEFRSKQRNLFGTTTYDIFLWINGFAGCVLLGCAVGMQFFGADFVVARQSILDGEAPVISVWNSSHGLEQIVRPGNLLLGFALYFLARTLGAMFFSKSVKVEDEDSFLKQMRKRVIVNGALFVVIFLGFLAVLFTACGYAVTADGGVEAVQYKYVLNLIDLWWIGLAFVVGVLMVVYGVGRGGFDSNFLKRQAFWWTGIGVVVAVTSLICINGYNNTAFLPSLTHPESSLTIANASSSAFTLKTMTVVSCLIPFVLAYIAYVWYKMTSPSLTSEELAADDHKY